MAINKDTGLTDKQEKFCQEYLIDLNGTQAAIRAGYSEKTAQAISTENLTKPLIQNYLASLKKSASERTQITSDMVLRELGKVAFIDLRKFYGADGRLLAVSDLPDDAAASLGGIETFEEIGFDPEKGVSVKTGDVKKIKIWDKLKALELLGKHLGFFEADNKQSKQDVLTAPVINVYNTPVPMANSEDKIVD